MGNIFKHYKLGIKLSIPWYIFYIYMVLKTSNILCKRNYGYLYELNFQNSRRLIIFLSGFKICFIFIMKEIIQIRIINIETQIFYSFQRALPNFNFLFIRSLYTARKKVNKWCLKKQTAMIRFPSNMAKNYPS